MPYTELTFTITPRDPGSEILVAQLAEIGFESFEETETGIKAYIPKVDFEESQVTGLGLFHMPGFEVSYTRLEVDDENWNRVWESSYSPVIIADQVYIRASFHPPRGISHEILIDPKMSFGTAHHETTAQMIEGMLTEDLGGKRVLDMGCGTAVLAILAERLGAAEVVAIDNDINAVENAQENVLKNNCSHVSVLEGAANEISGAFDVILANINKNILIRDMSTYASHLNSGGMILFSGFYASDLRDLKQSAGDAGLTFDRATSRNEWTVARFLKHYLSLDNA